MSISIYEAKKTIISECALALDSIDDQQSEQLIKAVLEAKKVFFTGVGRVLLSLQAVCKRFAHLGIDTHYIGEITEPAITSEDLLIVGSGSGETLFPVAMARKAKQLGAKLAWIGSNDESTTAKLADITVRIPVQSKLGRMDELKSQQPMTSLFEQTLLLYGDSLARVIIERKNLVLNELWQCHANLE